MKSELRHIVILVLVVLLAASLLFMALNVAGVWAGMSLTLLLCTDVALWLLMQLVIHLNRKST